MKVWLCGKYSKEKFPNTKSNPFSGANHQRNASEKMANHHFLWENEVTFLERIVCDLFARNCLER